MARPCFELWTEVLLSLHATEIRFVDQNLFNNLLFHSHPNPKLFKLFDQSFSIDQIDRWRAVTLSLSTSVLSKRSRSNQQPLICTPHHCAPKVSNQWRGNATLIAFALKNHMERQEPTNSNNTLSIDTAIAGLPSNLNLNKSRLAKNTLTQTFEGIGLHRLHNLKQLVFPSNIF